MSVQHLNSHQALIFAIISKGGSSNISNNNTNINTNDYNPANEILNTF